MKEPGWKVQGAWAVSMAVRRAAADAKAKNKHGQQDNKQYMNGPVLQSYVPGKNSGVVRNKGAVGLVLDGPDIVFVDATVSFTTRVGGFRRRGCGIRFCTVRSSGCRVRKVSVTAPRTQGGRNMKAM